MTRQQGSLRRWAVTACVIGVAVLLTVPWSFWVIAATYDRDEREKSTALAERVRFQLSSTWWWHSPQQVLNLMRGELLGDNTVQAVTFLYMRPGEPSKTDAFGYVRRSDSIPIPQSIEDINRLLNADPGSYRKYYTWSVRDNLQGVIYLDLSRAELRKYFKTTYWPVLGKVIALTATGIVVLSSMGIYVHQRWGREMQQRQRAELEQQGLVAERGLAAAVLAHEIRNPLAALRFQLHSLRRNSADPGRVSASADTIDAELLRIQQLVQDYLVHEKAQSVRVEAVDLADAAQNLQTLMSELLRESGTRMIIEAPASSVVVACDPHGLRQVLMNLVLNAQQAMGYGGTITVRIAPEEEFGRVSVADTGPGIPDEMRDRLFKPFATSKKGGSGIGLALVKRFVDNYGGTVSVDSQPGVGATFHLRLPAIGAVKAEGLEPTPNPATEGAIT